jgi:hypothetical protein
MNKSLKIILIIVSALIVVGVFYFITKDGDTNKKFEEDDTKTELEISNLLNATYIINGQKIKLTDGRAEKEAAPGSATKVSTATFGDAIYGDLDGDGDQDAALMLVQDPGGSGTFYYVAVTLNNDGQHQGTNAILLGDRVAPQNIAIEGNIVIANYADRRADDAMSARPSIGVSKYLRLDDGRLVDMSSNEAVCEKTSRLGIDSIPGGDFRAINEFGSAGVVSFSGNIVARDFSFFNDRFSAVYIIIPSFEVETPQAEFYSYFSNMFDFGNPINDKEGQKLLFKLGLLKDGRISSTANISPLAEAMILAALVSNNDAVLKIEIPIYVGAGAPENFSFACAVSVPE